MSNLRLKFLDYDARCQPKTEFFCIACQRDLDPTEPQRAIRITSEMMVVHPDDEPPIGAEAWQPIGNDCAKKLGLGWSVPIPFVFPKVGGLPKESK
jgi:hypothetical protein